MQRLAQKGDRRVNLIKITKKGSVLLDEIWLHYKKMVDDKQLTRSKFDELKKFWKEIKDNECPKCGKKDLVWEIIK